METPAPDEPILLQPRDRRQHERVRVRFALCTAVGDRYAWMMASNISLGGVRCRSEVRFRPAMPITVSVDFTGGRGDRGVEPVMFQAVVVRCQPRPKDEGSWDLGLFFPNPERLARERLARFIQSQRVT